MAHEPRSLNPSISPAVTRWGGSARWFGVVRLALVVVMAGGLLLISGQLRSVAAAGQDGPPAAAAGDPGTDPSATPPSTDPASPTDTGTSADGSGTTPDSGATADPAANANNNSTGSGASSIAPAAAASQASGGDTAALVHSLLLWGVIPLACLAGWLRYRDWRLDREADLESTQAVAVAIRLHLCPVRMIPPRHRPAQFPWGQVVHVAPSFDGGTAPTTAPVWSRSAASMMR